MTFKLPAGMVAGNTVSIRATVADRNEPVTIAMR